MPTYFHSYVQERFGNFHQVDKFVVFLLGVAVFLSAAGPVPATVGHIIGGLPRLAAAGVSKFHW
jgi:hypothetical protein